MSKWVGYAVSVNCGEPLGCYQGTILEADGNTITLTKAFRNGFPYPKSQVTLNASDIRDLRIIEERGAPAQQPHSTVAVAKGGKKGPRATVCESLQANPSSSGKQEEAGGGAACGARGGAGGAGGARCKPGDTPPSRSAPKPTAHPGNLGTASSTPKTRGGGGGGGGQEKARRRNEACFGEAAHVALDHDFDFEGNLALFDKRALWEQMNAHKPDVVRAADDAGAKFRHDENVLGGGGGGGGARAGILVPEAWRGPVQYVTDEGVAVPAVVGRARRLLWAGLARLGLAEGARLLLARAAADVALRLVGGGRRLDPRNAHQAPACVAVVGAHDTGAAGLAAARLLASHGARVHVHLAGAGGGCAAVQREVAALALSGVVPEPLESLPRPDVVLLAIYDLQLDEPHERYSAAVSWASCARGCVVCVEPPCGGWPGVVARASVQGVLPAALPPALGRAYLADVAPPDKLFTDLSLKYRPPFGAAPLLALHPATD